MDQRRASRTNSLRLGRIGSVRAIARVRQVKDKTANPGPSAAGSPASCLHPASWQLRQSATLSTVDTLISGTGADAIVFHRGGEQRIHRPWGWRRHPDIWPSTNSRRCPTPRPSPAAPAPNRHPGHRADHRHVGRPRCRLQLAHLGQRRQRRHRQQRSDPDRWHRGDAVTLGTAVCMARSTSAPAAIR